MQSMFAVVVLLSVRLSAAEDTDHHVLALTEANFDAAIKEHERVLVEFYTPGCGHCQSLKPEYNSAAADLIEQGLTTKLAKVDATVEEKLASKYEVSGYPTLKYFVNGKDENTRNFVSEGIVSWVKKRELPPIEELTQEQAKTFLDDAAKSEFRVLAYVKPKSARHKAYLNAVTNFLLEVQEVTLTFGLVWLPKSADPKADAKLSMQRPAFAEPDANSLEFTGSWADSNIAKWVLDATYPTVSSSFDSTSFFRLAKHFKDSGLQTGAVLAIVDDEDIDEDLADDTDDAADALAPKATAMLSLFAKEYPKWKFAVANVNSLTDADKELVPAMGSQDGQKVAAPRVWVLLNDEKAMGGRRFLLDDKTAFDQVVLEKFLANVNTGKIKRHFKSAKAPEPDREDGVLVLTGDTFEKHALNARKDVFVEFYAPWCGHCKKLEPIWNSLAEKVEQQGWGKKGVMVAKMDSTANECEEDVTGFPTLVLYPAVKSDKKMRSKSVFQGTRELPELTDFLLEKARNLEDVEEEVQGVGQKDKFNMAERAKSKKANKKEL